jgi:hypothetical protein
MGGRFVLVPRLPGARRRLSDCARAARDVALEALQGRVSRGNLAILKGHRVDLDVHLRARRVAELLGGCAGRNGTRAGRDARAKVAIDDANRATTARARSGAPKRGLARAIGARGSSQGGGHQQQPRRDDAQAAEIEPAQKQPPAMPIDCRAHLPNASARLTMRGVRKITSSPRESEARRR